MKLRLITILLVMASCFMAGAQTGELSQFFLVLPKTNPAFTGIDDFFQVNASYQQPWNDLNTDSENYSFSMFKSLGNKNALDGVQRGSRLSDPALISRLKYQPSMRRRHGVGLLVENTSIGPQQELDIKGYYAYHMPISSSFNLSFGSSIGIYQQEIDFSNYVVRNQDDDAFYQNLISSSGRQTRALVDFGIAAYTNNFYMSVTGRSLIDRSLGSNDLLNNFSRESSYYALVGYKGRLSNNVDVHVSGSVKYSELYDMDVLGAVRFSVKDVIYIGGSYDQGSKWALLLGVNTGKKLYLHYAYDRYTGFVSEFASGTHQITASFAFSNFYFKKPYSW